MNPNIVTQEMLFFSVLFLQKKVVNQYRFLSYVFFL